MIINITGKPLHALKNIGKTVASKLHELGVTTEDELKSLGAATIYKMLSDQNPEKHLPVCYYLYSLEGAIQNRHWDDFSDAEKAELQSAAGLTQ